MASCESTRNVLEKFLKEHEAEWWTPHEIKKDLGGDIRTVINGIRNLSRRPGETTCKGWRLEIAERVRLYCVRMVRNIDSSSKRTRVPTTSEEQTTIFDYPRERAHG